ncbi:hypothetical protein WR25_00582 [Diploscapter pachys]|uniref:7TM GPCR serpentine receptor class x (Srx) domain-containing protein n=1 Tax=Diploscapter pachys TaxID=2018661 RepID=A0A2A2JK09_9BILA|nr:hypothetical protein WR25_00582 [Diploscapter pachys]
MNVYLILSIIVAVEAIVGNTVLIIAIFTGCPSLTTSNRKTLFISSILRICYTISFAITSPDYTNTYDPVSSFPDSPWNITAFVSTVVLGSSIVVVMIYCWLQIRHVFCDNWNNLSAKTIKMMRQLQLTFLIQFLTSIVFFAFPFSLLLVGPVLKINPGRALIEFGTHLYRMFPAFSGWIIIIFVKEIRQSAWSFVSRSSKTGSSVDDSSQNNSKQRIVGHNS